MAATLSRDDLKLEQLIYVESVQVDGEEWELGGPRSFGQDTVCVQEELQYHGLKTYLGSQHKLSPILESLDIGELPPLEKTLPRSVSAIPAAPKYLRRCPGCVCNGSCRESTVANLIIKERNVKSQVTDPFYMKEAPAATAIIKPAVDLFVLCRSRASAEIYRAFQALESLEYPNGVLVVHVLDATNSLLAESLAQRNDFDFVRVDGRQLRLNDLEWAFELAKGDIVIGIDLREWYVAGVVYGFNSLQKLVENSVPA
ncbi:hypothetical protein D0865_10943 [Hortaea werneckii]|uniref:Uncharacterized protein n=1 Tax=Hortaea werneckii TaxID=91943 RepID=A0A3M7BVT6_HORWE|nr:hypothetical protein D0865_10943 [Hortaea werneckii]